MNKGLMPGMFGGKTFKGTNPDKEGVQYGPNTHEAPRDPRDILIDEVIGKSKIQYEPTGHVNCDPDRIEYLKS